jgi:hypothetical protein
LGVGYNAKAQPGYLTKEGDALHSGNLRAISSGKGIIKLNFREIYEWTKQIVQLPQVHFIFPLHGRGGWLCILKDGTRDNDVTVFYFAKMEAPDGNETYAVRV